MAALTLSPTDRDYILEAKFPYDQKTIDYIRKIPGCSYKPETKSWLVPIELKEKLVRVWGRTTVGPGSSDVVPHSFTMDKLTHILADTWPQLFEYQRQGIFRAVNTRRHFFADETGLGKSAQAVSALRALGHGTCLVVCPAIVRYSWKQQFDKWWPAHPPIGVIEGGLKRKVSKKLAEKREKAYGCPIRIVSYDLLSEVVNDRVESIIFDESHYFKSPASQQTKNAMLLVGKNSGSTLLGLSATLIPDRPVDLFGPLNLFWPGRFGKLNSNKKSSFAFNNRYSVPIVKNPDYPPTFEGVNQVYVEELRERLAFVCSRTTKNAVKHLLPPFTTQLYTIPNDVINPFSLSRWDWFCEKNLTIKRNWVVDWVDSKLSEGAKRVTLFTHTRKAAEAYYEAVMEKFPGLAGFCIHGDMPADKRMDALEHFNKAPMAFISATMHSLGVGINGLESSDQVLFAELYWRPETNIQAVGRFHRLSGRNPVTVSFLVLENSVDAVVAEKVKQKLEAIKSLQDAGVAEDSIISALDNQKTDEEMFLEIQNSLLGGLG